MDKQTAPDGAVMLNGSWDRPEYPGCAVCGSTEREWRALNAMGMFIDVFAAAIAAACRDWPEGDGFVENAQPIDIGHRHGAWYMMIGPHTCRHWADETYVKPIHLGIASGPERSREETDDGRNSDEENGGEARDA